jgi:hypothetical protein
VHPPAGFLNQRPGLFSADRYPRLPAEPRQQAHHVPSAQSNAAGGRTKSWSGEMHEYGAASTLNAWPRIVIEDDDHIVERVVAPKALGAGGIGMRDAAIVVAIPHSIAPAVIPSKGSHGQTCHGASLPIRPIENFNEPPPAAGRSAVTLPLGMTATRSPQRAGEIQWSDSQPSPCRRPRQRRHDRVMAVTTLPHRGSRANWTRDCHLSLDSCLKPRTSDMLRPQKWPTWSLAS